MKKIRYIIPITMSIILVSSCVKLPLYQSKVEPIAATLRYYDSNGKIMYDIYNNDSNIFVHIAIIDYAAQVKILKLGFTLWLDQKGGRNKDKGIIFPQKQFGSSSFKRESGRQYGQVNLNSQDKEKRQMGQLHKQYQMSLKNMTLIGMDGKNSQTLVNLELEKCDIQVSISFDTLNILHYKAVIPIEKIFTEEKYNDSIFSIGINSGFIEMSYASSSQGNPGGKKGAGGGMRGGGRSGGGKGSGGRQGGGSGTGNIGLHSALSEPIKTWFKVSLKPIAN